MKSIEALGTILKWNQVAFKTSDIACLLNVSSVHASKILFRLQETGQLIRLTRSVWAMPDRIDKLAIPEHLTAPWPSYISLQTALYHHGLISQIPAVTYAVSLSRSKRYETPLGTFSIHHISPSFFFGYQSTGKSGIKMAEPEKALADLLYLNPARSNLFKTPPEIEWPSQFQWKKLHKIVDKIASPRRQTLVKRLLQKLAHEI